MRTSIPVALALLAFLAATPASAENRVSVDSVTTFTNEAGVVPVTFVNDVALSALEMTFSFDSPDVQVDSFSFTGGRLEYVSTKGSRNIGADVTIFCLPLDPEPTIAPGSGLAGTLYLSWALDISPQFVTIDTITIFENDIEYSTSFSDVSSTIIRPEFDKGYVDIQQGFGCCIGDRGNVDNSSDQTPNVADLTYLVAFLFAGGPPPDCPLEADIDGEDGADPTVADVTYLVASLFTGGPNPVPCSGI